MKKILIATLTAGAITAAGGITVATINQNQIGVPMSEEPQTIIEEPEEEIVEVEYVDTPEEADIVIEKIIDEPVKAKAEVIEPTKVEEPKAVEKDECQEFKDFMIGRYGSLDFLAVIKAYRKGIPAMLDEAGIKTWEDFKTHYEANDSIASVIPPFVYNEAKGLEAKYNELCK